VKEISLNSSHCVGMSKLKQKYIVPDKGTESLDFGQAEKGLTKKKSIC
jgi:hypothetical protein